MMKELSLQTNATCGKEQSKSFGCSPPHSMGDCGLTSSPEKDGSKAACDARLCLAVQLPLLTLHLQQQSPPLSSLGSCREETKPKEEELKEWVWKHCKEQLLEHMELQLSTCSSCASSEPSGSSSSLDASRSQADGASNRDNEKDSATSCKAESKNQNLSALSEAQRHVSTSCEASSFTSPILTHLPDKITDASQKEKQQQQQHKDDDDDDDDDNSASCGTNHDSSKEEQQQQSCCLSVLRAHVEALDQKAQERTHKLEVANQRLELANQRVRQAAKSQLEHFALISHEVRTPLNCVLGLSSMLLHEDDDCCSNNKRRGGYHPQHPQQGLFFVGGGGEDHSSPPQQPVQHHHHHLSPSQRETIQMIVDAGELLLTVINDVLDYSKLETGHMDFVPRKSSLETILAAVMHNIESKDVSKQITVKPIWGDITVPEFITTDPRRLQQILYNLLGNSLKFSPAGSVIELGVELDDAFTTSSSTADTNTRYFYTAEERQRQEQQLFAHTSSSLTLSVKEDGDDDTAQDKHMGALWTEDESSSSSCHSGGSGEALTEPSSTESVLAPPPAKPPSNNSKQERNTSSSSSSSPDRIIRFKVKDYGTGIAVPDFPRIFQPFRQAGSETEQVHGGTGLGLAVTAKLVHGLGGVISVSSVCGEWTEFMVELPLVVGADEEDSSSLGFSVEQVSAQLATTTVYLIDHNSDTVQQLVRVFEQCRVQYQVFSSMMEMEDDISSRGPLPRDRTFLCMVQETLHDEEAYDLLSNLATSVLVTYGPKYSVLEGAHHFRAPHKILPSVLLTTLLQQVVQKKRPGLSRSGSFSSVSTSVYTIPTSELRVLIAEDNKVNQKVLERMFHRIKVKNVTIVDNGLRAIEACVRNDFDLVLMDYCMPLCDGVTSCRTILSRPDIVHKPKIVFVTAHVGASFEEECYQAGGSGYLTKPFNLQEIQDCVASVEMEVYDPSVYGLAERDFEEETFPVHQ